jgi:hypothetical protein
MATTDLEHARRVRIRDNAICLDNPADAEDVHRTHAYYCALFTCGMRYVRIRAIGAFAVADTMLVLHEADDARVISYVRDASAIIADVCGMRVRLHIPGYLPCTITFEYDPDGNVEWRYF